jgi:hypothetical protein
MPAAAELAKAIAGTDFVPQGIRNNPAAIAAAILYGDEVGLGPMQSLAKIAVINGTPGLYAEAQRALILQAGHDLWIEEATTTRVTLAGRRRNSDQTTRVTWTMDDAKRAGLAGKPMYRTYPRQMLLARASAELARATFADAIGGLPAIEEFEGDEPPQVPPDEPTAIEAAPSSRRRRRTDIPAVTVSAPPPPEPAPDETPPLPGEEEKASQAQLRRLFALYRERGITERDARLDHATLTLGRKVETSSDLSLEEASRLISDLTAAGDPGPEEDR